MIHSRLRLLGGFDLRASDGTERQLPTRKDRQLLAFLALQNGRAVSRSRLASLFWGDRAEEQARDSLRRSLSALRQALRGPDSDPILADRVNVTLDLSAVCVDALDFVDACEGDADMAAAAELYAGPLLEDIDTATPEFEHWLLGERQRLDGVAERLVVSVCRSEITEKTAAAATKLAQALFARDPTLEPIARALMRLCVARGERAAALKIYALCKAALFNDLDVQPDHETEALYRDILTDRNETGAVVPAPEPADVAEAKAANPPFLAVLPLANLTGSDRFDYLCEGLAEDITTGLGRFRTHFVIDRYSAMAVAAATADTQEIGRRLGASLLVQGSIQSTRDTLRITVRLVHSESRAQIWSDAFECALDDVPGVPARIASSIVCTLQNRAENAIIDRAGKAQSIAAYECVLRGVRHLRGYGSEDNDRAIGLFRNALELDPGYALAKGYLAFSEVVIHDYDDAPRAVLEESRTRLQDALSLDPEDARLHWLLGLVHGYLHEATEERLAFERAIALNPNDANTLASYGGHLADFERCEDGIAMIREAMRLNPYHPEWYWLSLGDAFVAAGRHADAIEAYRRRTRPKIWVLTRLAGCYAMIGQTGQASEMARLVLEQDPGFTISGMRVGDWSKSFMSRLVDGLRQAGLPD